jgi:pilus assembly protein CpaD
MSATDRKDDTAMVSKASLAALFALSGSLAACSGSTTTAASLEPNRSLYSLNQPVVERFDYVMDLSTDGSGLSAAERGRLVGWFRSIDLGYGDHVFVEEPYASGGREAVAKVTAEYGLLLGDGAPVTAGQVQPGSTRVVVSRSRAHVPNCPNWDMAGGPSSTSSNYGCAVNSNLAAMIADPNDLVLGQTGASAGDAATASKAVRAYRSRVPSGASGDVKSEATRGGK